MAKCSLWNWQTAIQDVAVLSVGSHIRTRIQALFFPGDLAFFWSSLLDDSMEGCRVRGSGRCVKGLTWESCYSFFSHSLLCWSPQGTPPCSVACQGKVSSLSSHNGQNLKSSVQDLVRPSFCLKALGSPSVPHPAANLRIQRRVASSCHIGGLPHLFSIGNTSPRKHLTSHCFASAVEGGSKPALHLCAFYLLSILEGGFSMYLKKPWQIFQKWSSFCSDLFSVSLKIKRVSEAKGLGKQQWCIQTSWSAFTYCLKDCFHAVLTK